MKPILFLFITILTVFSAQAQQNQSHAHPEHLENLVNEYLNMKNSLIADDFESARTHLQAFSDEVMNNRMMHHHEEHPEQHEMHHSAMAEAVTAAENADNIASFRLAFKSISEQLLIALENQGYEGQLFRQYCPMYEGGSSWISQSNEIRNPFYGSMMHNCGETVEIIE